MARPTDLRARTARPEPQPPLGGATSERDPISGAAPVRSRLGHELRTVVAGHDK